MALLNRPNLVDKFQNNLHINYSFPEKHATCFQRLVIDVWLNCANLLSYTRDYFSHTGCKALKHVHINHENLCFFARS